MNVADFTYLLQKPNKVTSPIQTKQLEDILEEYPYFQAARALHLKGLKNLNSFKYNNALKVTAAHTADRDVLFNFITSEKFIQNGAVKIIKPETLPLKEEKNIPTESDLADNNTTIQVDSIDKPLPQNIDDAEHILDPKLFKSKDPEIDIELAKEKEKAYKELNLGKPLEFTQKEKHSFSEWLQLTTKDNSTKEPAKQKVDLKKKKFDLIDKFIENNPKIVPHKKTDAKVDIKESVKLVKNELMTETLAQVYLEQKKYKKAIQAYKILSLKYPEKSSFFADRIKAAEKIQQDNI